jgi:hypothetical protein
MRRRRPKSEKCPKCGKDMIESRYMPDSWLCEMSCGKVWTREALNQEWDRQWEAGAPEREAAAEERKRILKAYPWAGKTQLKNVFVIEGMDGMYVRDENGAVEAVVPCSWCKVERWSAISEKQVFERMARKKWKKR